MRNHGIISLVGLFFLSNGTISRDVFDMLIVILPSLTWIDYTAATGYIIAIWLLWLLKDILVAYKNKIVRSIENDTSDKKDKE
jgi:hypothetical protein